MRRNYFSRICLFLASITLIVALLITLPWSFDIDKPGNDADDFPLFLEEPDVSEEPSPSPTPPSLTPASPSPEASPSPSEEPSPEPITAMPVRIIIHGIEVDAEMIGTERDEKVNSMAVYPSASVISWYMERPIPGNEGNAVLAGHNRWRGKKGVIAPLNELEVGDEMTIEYDDGTERDFCLESVFEYPLKTAPAGEIMRADGPARVTIITCSGKYNTSMGTSENRLVAVFKPKETFVIPDPPVTPIPLTS